jgi:hypothetical protein
LNNANVKMTQEHCSRVEEDGADGKLAEAWKNTPILTGQTLVIDERYGVSGYA